MIAVQGVLGSIPIGIQGNLGLGMYSWRILGSDKEAVQEGKKKSKPVLCVVGFFCCFLGVCFFFFSLSPVLKLLMLFFSTDRRGQMSYLESRSEIWGMRLIMGLFVMNF